MTDTTTSMNTLMLMPMGTITITITITDTIMRMCTRMYTIMNTTGMNTTCASTRDRRTPTRPA